ncbi:5-formyltetrahydrofolate cyclo-ligase [uncultured Nocardioides sp.]|uniref:5-formyltetrahydrofolate cyclo-ligase n=1 Tax=uncultured Nocardioides sp. TaxID=198441 RepID=UPI0026210772|nr:5-formyltetrahydrofolate cyclo-ligase [uncultured Nocardioides sp.]
MGSSQAVAKTGLRDQLLAARRRRPLAEVTAGARARTAHLLDSPELARAASVAAYVSVGSEPGTTELLDALRDLDRRVLLPVLRPDGDLDWAPYDGPASLAPAGRGLLEPVTARAGRDAIATCDVVVVPGLAVDAAGMRLGRGGGSYDRALARVPRGTPVWVLLHEDELDRAVPAEPHDRAVTGAVTESGVRRF